MTSERPKHIPDDIAETPEEREWFVSKPRAFVDQQAKVEAEAAAIERKEMRKEILDWMAEEEIAATQEAIERTLGPVFRRVKRLGRNVVLAGALLGGTSFAAPMEQRDAILEAPRTSEAWKGLPSEEEMLEALDAAYGRDAVREMLPTERPERRDWESEPIAEVGDGFEQFGIDRAAIRQLLEDGYPRFMTARDTVSHIVYADERYPVPESYGLRSDAHALASCANAPGREAAVVTYYRDAFEREGGGSLHDLRNEALHETLPHELAHAVDWQDMADIDPARRMEILYRLTQLVQDEQHMLQFGYAEHIENPDPHERLRNRATEYFADLVAAVVDFDVRDDDREDAIFNTAVNLHFRHGAMPEELERLPPQDARRQDWEETMRERTLEAVRLVYDYVHAVDPEFDFASASLTREKVMQEMEEAHLNRQLGEIMERLPPRIRAAMESTRHVSSEGVAETIVSRNLDASEDQGYDTPSREVMIFLISDEGQSLAPEERQRLQAVAERARVAEEQVVVWVSDRFHEIFQGLSNADRRIWAPLMNIMSKLHLHDQRGGHAALRAADLAAMAGHEERLGAALAGSAYPESVIAAVEGAARLYRRDVPIPQDLLQAVERAEREVDDALAMP